MCENAFRHFFYGFENKILKSGDLEKFIGFKMTVLILEKIKLKLLSCVKVQIFVKLFFAKFFYTNSSQNYKDLFTRVTYVITY